MNERQHHISTLVSYWRDKAIQHAVTADKNRRSWKRLAAAFCVIASLFVAAGLVASGMTSSGFMSTVILASSWVSGGYLIALSKEAWNYGQTNSQKWLLLREESLRIAKIWEQKLEEWHE